ncbi:MAG: hypothetical protein ACYTGC_12970 [Planctomycetota bacterium]|jgi:hypothetical protein
MRRPGTDPDDVQMSDVLCDFCHREWTEDEPMLEGHHGSCVCGRCLTDAYTTVVLQDAGTATDDYTCPMCLEGPDDRQSLNRGGEPGWPSPLEPGKAMCRRCIKLAAGTLHKNRDFDWTKPEGERTHHRDTEDTEAG